ncbi:conserved hypothetical protein [Ricinus communis]|uniref:Uncharacterized protein n=1 Tax=Ricinus communis TaxID=3988 RepID=B9T954_RICCO|nr:conserved hypothetical protein [Ricinus communis]
MSLPPGFPLEAQTGGLITKEWLDSLGFLTYNMAVLTTPLNPSSEVGLLGRHESTGFFFLRLLESTA